MAEEELSDEPSAQEGDAVEGEEEAQPEKKNKLFAELFGEGESESEDSFAEQPPTTRTEHEKEPEVRPSQKPTHHTLSQKKNKEIEPDDLQDTMNEEQGEGLEEPVYSNLPTYTSTLDAPEDQVIEEQELVLEEMPYERPPEGSQLHFFKLAAGLSIEPKPFQPETFNAGEDEEGTDEGARKQKKKSATTTVRWRYGLDKNLEVIKESNARFVKWSDGTMHFFVGKDAFGVQLQDFKDHHHLFIRHTKDMNSESFLQCQGLLEKKVILNPIDNVAQLKKEALLKMRNAKSLESNKDRRQFVASTNDPEKEKKQKEQMESNRSELKRKFGRDQDLSKEFLEQGVDSAYDEEKEKASEARIIAAKKGQHLSDEEEGLNELFGEEDSASGEDAEPERKRSRR